MKSKDILQRMFIFIVDCPSTAVLVVTCRSPYGGRLLRAAGVSYARGLLSEVQEKGIDLNNILIYYINILY